jgi:Uma2 family endonuclease
MRREATIQDLHKVEGRAELVHGRIVRLPLFEGVVGTAAANILFSLTMHERAHGGGCAYGASVAFICNPRRTVSPAVSWYVGPEAGPDFPTGAPVFAVELRDVRDYGPAAERRRQVKRTTYFEYGTQVVWDVDALREERIRVYRATDPESADVYKRGEVADAEPAVPGGRFPVDELFR